MNKELINKDVLKEIIADSPLCQHADKELRLAGYTPDGDGPEKWMYDQVMEAVAVFSSHGNSGFSAGIETGLVKKLCSWDIVSPLMFGDDEWVQRGDDHMQNRRKGTIFKEKDGSITDIEAYRCCPLRRKCYGARGWEKIGSATCWSGELFETYRKLGGDGRIFLTGRSFRRCCIRYNFAEGYVPKPTVKVFCDEVEISPDNWIYIVRKDSKDLERLAKEYRILWKYHDTLRDMDVTEITEEIMHKVDEECKDNKF